jgi:salicylate hydroxylase
MSGYTQPLSHLSTDDLGIAHWMLYNDCILTTWPCKENRQWFIGVKAVARDAKNPDRSVWKGATPETVNAVYGDKFHPFGKDSSVEASTYISTLDIDSW